MIKSFTKIIALLLIINSFFLFTGCQAGSNSQQEVSTEVVTIKNFSFGPQNIELKTGDEVTWFNGDSAAHSVKLEGMFDSGPINSGNSFNYRFDKAGTYEYTCSIHPTMKGIIVVK